MVLTTSAARAWSRCKGRTITPTEFESICTRRDASYPPRNDWPKRTITPNAYAVQCCSGTLFVAGECAGLRNVVGRQLLLADDAVDAAAVRLALPLEVGTPAGAGGSLPERVDAYEREMIVEELKRQNKMPRNASTDSNHQAMIMDGTTNRFPFEVEVCLRAKRCSTRTISCSQKLIDFRISYSA